MAINVDSFHNQNAIIAKIQSALTLMLSDLGINDWQVLRSNQSTIQALQNNSVYYDIISKRRIGTQGTKSVMINGSWTDQTKWYEEYLIQVGAFLQRNPDEDNEGTLSSSDIVSMLQGCVNSNGVLASKNYFSENWIQVIKSTNIRELDYETDSGLREKMPQFDFILVIEQVMNKDIHSVDDIDMDIYRV